MDPTEHENSSQYQSDDDMNIHHDRDSDIHQKKNLNQNQIALKGFITKRNAARTVEPGELENGNYFTLLFFILSFKAEL